VIWKALHKWSGGGEGVIRNFQRGVEVLEGGRFAQIWGKGGGWGREGGGGLLDRSLKGPGQVRWAEWPLRCPVPVSDSQPGAHLPLIAEILSFVASLYIC